MHCSNWKNSERCIAAQLGGCRVPGSGCGRGDVPDVEHLVYAIEHKANRVLNARLRPALDQAASRW